MTCASEPTSAGSVDEDGCCNSCGCSAEAHATIASLRSRLADLDARFNTVHAKACEYRRERDEARAALADAIRSRIAKLEAAVTAVSEWREMGAYLPPFVVRALDEQELRPGEVAGAADSTSAEAPKPEPAGSSQDTATIVDRLVAANTGAVRRYVTRAEVAEMVAEACERAKDRWTADSDDVQLSCLAAELRKGAR